MFIIIIEFVGLPGSGKTTLAKKIIEEEIEGFKTVFPFNELYKRNWLKRNLLKINSIINIILTSPLVSVGFIKLILKTKQSNISDSFRLMFNTLFLYRWIKYYQKSKDVVIFDEGIIHYCWAINLGANKELEAERFISLFNVYSKKTIYVRCNDEQIQLRLNKRNNINSRINFVKDNIDLNIKNIENLLGKLKKDKIFTVNNNELHEQNQNIQLIKEWLVE